LSTFIFSVEGNNNIVYRNVIEDATFGLDVSGMNNIVCINEVTNCREGLYVAINNVYYANLVANNMWGIVTRDTELNPFGEAGELYHNNFVDNTYQPYSINQESEYFDNGEEGNYWSDYTGTDADGDGIGDTPYVISANRSDRYPLMTPFDIDSVTVELPEWITPPYVQLISPQNTTYTFTDITLEFTTEKQSSWIGYSIDGQEILTITSNTTISGLSNGLHNVTIYTKDTFENVIIQETIWFSITEAFPMTLVLVTSLSIVTVVVISLIVHFKKYKH
jgi:hypothetical protein